jgi:hypothetical protein
MVRAGRDHRPCECSEIVDVLGYDCATLELSGVEERRVRPAPKIGTFSDCYDIVSAGAQLFCDSVWQHLIE